MQDPDERLFQLFDAITLCESLDRFDSKKEAIQAMEKEVAYIDQNRSLPDLVFYTVEEGIPDEIEDVFMESTTIGYSDLSFLTDYINANQE